MKELDLSHNEFSEKGGEHLGQMLGNPLITSPEPAAYSLGTLPMRGHQGASGVSAIAKVNLPLVSTF